MSRSQLKNFDLATLRSFVTIVETGSMTRAAARLFMTQSAISMQIKRLEKSLGFRVFDRSAQGMPTTTEGEQLLKFAQQMLAINDEAMGRLTSPDFEGQVRLGAPDDVIYPHIPEVLRAFSRDYPRVQVKLISGSTTKLKNQFKQGQLDVVLTTEKSVNKVGQVIFSDCLVWVGAEGGIVWKKRPLPLGISTNCAFRACVINALEENHIEWEDVVASEDDIAARALVAADLCVTAELRGINRQGRVAMKHGGQLPDLPVFSVVLYTVKGSGNHLADTLAEHLSRALK